MTERTYTALFPFGGLGGGALGFLEASVEGARFQILGGIDVDAEACRDFEHLTGAPSLCADVLRLTPTELRAFAGERAPDVIFLSPPCKGASGLLSAEKAKTEKYKALNRLALVWLRLQLATWAETRPRLVLLENVPRLRSRAPEVLDEAIRLLKASGYAVSEGYHDCGEIGGLAQHRRRYLLVARHEQDVPALLYQPPRLRVRGCGEVLGTLPLPGDPTAGPLHALPRLSWLNWVRLALIPAGGDWRDLPGVLADGEARRSKFRKRHVAKWDDPSVTVTGRASGGGNGPYAVADVLVQRAYDHGYAVLRWDQASWTIAGKSHPGNGAYAVADPRLGCEPRAGAYGVLPWDSAATTVTGAAAVDNGAFAIADPRLPPPRPVVIIAADGTWHRPLTTLELAALQGLPAQVRGEPLRLAGKSSTRWRERIGNAVPVGAARAVAEQMLRTLAGADDGAWSLSSNPIWVAPPPEAADHASPPVACQQEATE